MSNPFGDHVRVVDRRRVDYQDIDHHVDLQEGDGLTKALAKSHTIPQLRDLADKHAKRGDFGMADRLHAAAAIRRSGVPPEVLQPGQLHEVVSFDPRTMQARTEYFGDIGAYFGPLMQPPLRAKLNRDPGVTYQEVRLKPGERAVVVKG